MPFDQPTRNRLTRFVGEARRLLTEEFTRQLQNEYGLDPATGEVSDLSRLMGLDDVHRETARILRETLQHHLASERPAPRRPAGQGGRANEAAKTRQPVLERIVREQAFTVLNRLCALRMAEARGILIETVSQGYRSRGFQLYARLAGPALGETGDAYRSYLLSVWDELAIELPPLFDRYSPQGRLFPREAALLGVLELLNAPDLAALWAEDETIGWIYQYFNSKEERQAMRAESGAPRNSRELAVRNQFFTTRYVVEFLTDNTLGRTWYEMTQGRTELKESCRYLVRRPNEMFLAPGEEAPAQADDGADLSQEELLRQPVYIAYRSLKDPRDITMLDPACGSMHFGLYAFDLYERIYEEAWDLEDQRGADAFARPEGLKPLHETYPSKDAFLREVPRLIIERNIHGIDIDPRAVQIAGLSLWLRAQRFWQAQGVTPQDRPPIRRANIVCAEPMPGDEGMLDEFLAGLRGERLESLVRRALQVPPHQRVRVTPAMADALSNLVRTVWQEMQLAGEAGSLLKIEETLADAIAKGRAEWEEKMPLFRVLEFGLGEAQPQVSYARAVPGEGEDFWDRVETLVLAALEGYAERAENGGNYRRRLFAGDAARGFAFIDLCRKLWDVVLMNPPFGELAESAKTRIEASYRNVTGNILCAFLEAFAERSAAEGLVGCVVDRTILIKNSYEAFRHEQLLSHGALASVLELGWNVLDANVEVAAVTIRRNTTGDRQEVFGANVTLQGEKNAALLLRCAAPTFVRHIVFQRMPFMAINFEVPTFFSSSLQSMRSFSDEYGSFYNGHTIKSDVFKRLAWEVSLRPHERLWERMWNGSDYSPFYVPMQEVVLVERYGGGLVNHEATVWRSPNKHKRSGLCYGKRGDYLDVQVLPSGCVLTNEGFGGPFPESSATWSALGLLNSRVVQYMLNLYCGQHKGVGYVGQLPVPNNDRLQLVEVDIAAAELHGMVRDANRILDTDPCFVTPFVGFAQGCSSLRHMAEKYIVAQGAYNASCLSLDETIMSLYRVADEERELVRRDTASRPTAPLVLGFPAKDMARAGRCISALLVSYLVGCAYGRWDIRFSTGQLPVPGLAAPFSPLPVCPPGMLQNADGQPISASDMPQSYPLRIVWSGIIPNDDDHPWALERQVRKALALIWHDNADTVVHEACQMLDISSLRDYLARPDCFFADHVQSHSKSRRQAPIYWPLATPSGSYTLWLYYHRLTDQTLYSCVNDFVDHKLKDVSAEASRLRQKSARNNAEEKHLEELSDLGPELKELRAELLRVAAFWKPDLNDGVQITAAPLWRLFQYKPWQKRLKETWEKLEAGDYDLAHLAYSIWPERVREKCRTDKSLAIAHGLEELYVRPPAGKGGKRRGRAAKAREEEEDEDLFDAE